MGMTELLTVKEVAEYLRVSRTQVRRLIRSGQLHGMMIGREYRISLASLAEFTEEA